MDRSKESIINGLTMRVSTARKLLELGICSYDNLKREERLLKQAVSEFLKEV